MSSIYICGPTSLYSQGVSGGLTTELNTAFDTLSKYDVKFSGGEFHYYPDSEDIFLAQLPLSNAVALVAAGLGIHIEGYPNWVELTDAQWEQTTPTGLNNSIKYDDTDPDNPISQQRTWHEWADVIGLGGVLKKDGKVFVGSLSTKYDLSVSAFLVGQGLTLLSKAEYKALVTTS